MGAALRGASEYVIHTVGVSFSQVAAFLKGIKGASILLNEPRVKKTLPSEPPSHRTQRSRQTP